MIILRKVKTANSILREKGFKAFIKELKRRFRNLKDAYRPDEVKIAFEILGANMSEGLMIDVGAHFGGALERFADNGWNVIAFEPDSENRKKLVAAFGSLPNVEIDPRAVSDRDKEGVIFYRSKESTGISALAAFHPSHKIAERVDLITLESFFEEKGVIPNQIDFLKIDAEGHDLFVLRGFPWRKIFPRLILCEFEDSKTKSQGYTFHDLANFLQDYGYKIMVSEWYPVKQYGGDHNWRRFVEYPCELVDEEGWGNIFAVKEELLWESLRYFCLNQN